MLNFEERLLALLAQITVSQQELASSVRVLADAVNDMKETSGDSAEEKE
jgi:hypothetical protein